MFMNQRDFRAYRKLPRGGGGGGGGGPVGRVAIVLTPI